MHCTTNIAARDAPDLQSHLTNSAIANPKENHHRTAPIADSESRRGEPCDPAAPRGLARALDLDRLLVSRRRTIRAAGGVARFHVGHAEADRGHVWLDGRQRR